MLFLGLFPDASFYFSFPEDHHASLGSLWTNRKLSAIKLLWDLFLDYWVCLCLFFHPPAGVFFCCSLAFCLKRTLLRIWFWVQSKTQPNETPWNFSPGCFHQLHTFIGMYHLRGLEGLCMPLLRMRMDGGTYSCSGIFTLAFLAFSNLAPSSVEPFSPQRT